MQVRQQQLVLTHHDYNVIMSYLKTGLAKNSFNRQNAADMETELKKARLVSSEELPAEVVRLNSTVVVKDENDGKIMELVIVTPEKADIRQKKISVMSPVGTALIGFRKGQQVKWQVPAGVKTFTILDVKNPVEEQ